MMDIDKFVCLGIGTAIWACVLLLIVAIVGLAIKVTQCM